MKFVLSCDNNYFRYVYVAIKTLLENNKENKSLKVVFIEENVSKTNLEHLKNLGQEFNREVEIISFKMPEVFEKLPAYGESKTTFAKFTFSSLFSDDVVVFLDPDVLVLGDISSFDDIDMTGYMFAGVIENLPNYHHFYANLGEDDSYINGGVLICNLKLWRERNFENEVIEYMSTNTKNFNYDQGILNELCKGEIKVIHPKYNALAEIFQIKSAKKLLKRYKFSKYYSQSELDDAINNPIIVHFTYFLYGKPLMIGCKHPYANVFLDNLNSSPLDKNLYKNNLGYKIKIRRFVLRFFPFSVYVLFERLLDIRRKREMKKQL
ncbi:MAG: glycosyltransferase family 8 protein [Acholeplasma sp.]|nr:glycosyltransferase family 8 protein [Acholeplasma sp.]